MESQKTKILLDKYWEGQSTLEEEELLASQLAKKSAELNKEDKKYSIIFDYKELLKQEEAEEFDLAFLEEIKKNRIRTLQDIPDYGKKSKWAMGLVASLIVAVMSVTYQMPKTQTLEAQSIQMENAYHETLATLQLVAEKLNKGNSIIEEISVFDRTTKHIIYEN